ncbi:hypothetical protein [Candidatus Amarolinea dominans]|uniref:hypothetical protein n=1 Tax=Candidatus Amarolinea dominans TaxID=3140696 RepID=UPI003136B0E4|nr:hypothetical protein [Anaerolineae bacterium]
MRSTYTASTGRPHLGHWKNQRGPNVNAADTSAILRPLTEITTGTATPTRVQPPLRPSQPTAPWYPLPPQPLTDQAHGRRRR